VEAFTQDFLIQLTNAQADGMTFIIQNAGISAIGNYGGSLGYAGIAPSAAVKFDLYDNMGEGINSTGIYTGGVQPMVPAIKLSGTPIDLHSGDVMSVHMNYDGAILAMQITDMQTNQSYSTQWTVDLPAAVGGTTAYLGFGASTGGLGAMQDVLAWTYVSQGGSLSQSVPPKKASTASKPGHP
jgi:hypothetical protein